LQGDGVELTEKPAMRGNTPPSFEFDEEEEIITSPPAPTSTKAHK